MSKVPIYELSALDAQSWKNRAAMKAAELTNLIKRNNTFQNSRNFQNFGNSSSRGNFRGRGGKRPGYGDNRSAKKGKLSDSESQQKPTNMWSN